MNNIIDITYAVSEKEAQGRKRMKNMDTGELWWEEVHAPGVEHIEIVAPEPRKAPADLGHFKAKERAKKDAA